MDFNSNPAVWWFIIGLIILVLEFVAPGLVLFFFGVGAWLVAILCLIFDITLNLQLFIFVVTSVVLLLSLRKWMQKLFKGKMNLLEKFSEDEFAGLQVTVVETISPPKRGKVEVHGTNWNAEAETEIPKGQTVEIIKKNNLTLKVKSLN